MVAHRSMALMLVGGCGFTGTAPLPEVMGSPDAPVATIDAAPGLPDGAPLDGDGDGRPDAADNCPSTPNADQADEDTDAVGNACDNCPHLANANQANTGETGAGQSADTVGDACDPQPTIGGNSIALFLPFDAPGEISAWNKAGTGQQFVVMNGQLKQIGQSDLAILWRNDLDLANAWLETSVTYDGLGADQFRGAAIMTRFRRVGDFGHGVGCGEMRDSVINGGSAFYNILRFTGAAFNNTAVSFTGASVAVTHSARYSVHRTGGDNYACTVGASTFTGSHTLVDGGGTGINLATWGVQASFKYLVAIK